MIRFFQVLMLALLVFCVYGISKSVEVGKERSIRAREVQCDRLRGMGNAGLCIIEGRLINLDRSDYREQARKARNER
ncbi:hypothetical protein PQD76_gp47 [Stenotrophomonas phage BUCT626]|uniref:Uncharacterized protein n=2 Tax=Bixiavirus TaxID=3044676 RepID=A0AC61NML5_9CAUD|nr:hypothetical protein PQD76_gp47 [Stenotrophomonas phage BUCT626]QYC96751.1 hypothetical protein [Stenotrophomonas phage BUCT626]